MKMDAALLKMIERYDCKTAHDYENALKEIIQHLALLGLWRSKFFEHAAFWRQCAQDIPRDTPFL